jgi:hypothetical protein
MTEMLVDQATTYQDAVQAVFRMVKERPYVSSLDIEARPILAYALVLGNRKGLSVDDMRSVLSTKQMLRRLVDAAVKSSDEQERLAARLLERWLNDPIQAEQAHKTGVLVSAHALLFEQRSSF